jgi:hypothetical protein
MKRFVLHAAGLILLWWCLAVFFVPGMPVVPRMAGGKSLESTAGETYTFIRSIRHADQAHIAHG